MPLKKISVLVYFLLIFADCRGQARSNFDVDRWSGRLLDGSSFKLAEIKAPKVVLNFYSPTCAPCIQEIPALKVFSEEAGRRGIPVYVALEANPTAHDLHMPDGSTKDDVFSAIRNRMLEDIQKYAIELPVVIMDPEFHIDQKTGTVTGTPETLIFSTAPLTLRYDFIGPLSIAASRPDFDRDSRFQFALQRL